MITEIEVKHKLMQKIVDEQFDTEQLVYYSLSIQVNFNLLRFCVIDNMQHRCLYLEDYQLNDIHTFDELTTQLDFLFDNHIILKAGYWKSIHVAIKDTQFTHIPTALYESAHIQDYLNLTTSREIKEDQLALSYFHISKDITSVFSISTQLKKWFDTMYPTQKIKYINHTSSFLEGVFQISNRKQDAEVYIQVEQHFLTIAVLKNNQLLFCNGFTFNSSEDFVYFVLFVYDQLQLNPEQTPLTIWGEILDDSDSFNKLYKYIRYIKFGEKPKTLSFGFPFDEIHEHRYFDLYTMHLCQ
jgi:hypothetical protein